MDNFVVLSGSANPALARAIAERLASRLASCRIERFPDGEISAELEQTVRDQHVFVVQPTSPPVNDHLMELAALADACRRAAAHRVIAVAPYLGYARADRRKHRRVPIMGRIAADLLEASGVQHLVTMDLHSPQIEGFFHIPVENLSAVPLLVETLRGRIASDSVVVSPDFGAVQRASAFAEMLGCSIAILPKRRLSGSEVEVSKLIGEVAGRPCVILDDMISTGGTILKAIEAVRDAGGRPDILVVATHGVFTAGAREKLLAAGAADLLVTDTVAACPGGDAGVRRVSVAPLLAAALRRIAVGESLRDLF
jgi:ribose-phosphate pyrophosphokinase